MEFSFCKLLLWMKLLYGIYMKHILIIFLVFFLEAEQRENGEKSIEFHFISISTKFANRSLSDLKIQFRNWI